MDKVRSLYGIGDSISSQIEFFLKNGYFEDRIKITMNKKEKLEELQSIWGVGPSGAEKLYEKGFHTIDDLRKAEANGESPLSSLQKIGLKYHEDLQQQIPRQEIQNITDIVRDACRYLFPCLSLQVEAVGSFRRGKDMCGDIDILITPIGQLLEDDSWYKDNQAELTYYDKELLEIQ